MWSDHDKLAACIHIDWLKTERLFLFQYIKYFQKRFSLKFIYGNYRSRRKTHFKKSASKKKSKEQ